MLEKSVQTFTGYVTNSCLLVNFGLLCCFRESVADKGCSLFSGDYNFIKVQRLDNLNH